MQPVDVIDHEVAVQAERAIVVLGYVIITIIMHVVTEGTRTRE